MTRTRFAAGTAHRLAGLAADAPAARLAGSAAALVWARDPLAADAVRIHAWSPHGAVLLDAGPGVEPGSLRIDGHTARWTRAGEPQAADLSALP